MKGWKNNEGRKLKRDPDDPEGTEGADRKNSQHAAAAKWNMLYE